MPEFMFAAKLILRSLKTSSVSVAKLLMADLETGELKKAEDQVAVTTGKMTFGDGLALSRDRLEADVNLKPRSKEYRQQRTNALLKSWPGLADKDVRQISIAGLPGLGSPLWSRL